MTRFALISASVIGLSAAGGLGLAHAHSHVTMQAVDAVAYEFASGPAERIPNTRAPLKTASTPLPTAPKLVVQSAEALPAPTYETASLAPEITAAPAQVAQVRPATRPAKTTSRAFADRYLAPNVLGKVKTEPSDPTGSNGLPQLTRVSPDPDAPLVRTFAFLERESNITPRYLLGVFR